jgi:hypothetical protein
MQGLWGCAYEMRSLGDVNYKITPVYLYHLPILQKMEKTRYGVKTSLLEELKSFQLRLKKRRRMTFNITILGNNMPSLQTTLMTGEDRVSITNMTFPSVVRREDYIDQGGREITLILHGVLVLNIQFDSFEHKIRFQQEM